MKDREIHITYDGKKCLLPKTDINTHYDDHVNVSHLSMIRPVLLREVCRNIDILDNLRWKHSVNLVRKEDHENEYITGCPFCSTPGTLVLNKKTGICYCRACELTEDFFTMKCAYRSCKLEHVLDELCTILAFRSEPEACEPVRNGGVI